MDLSLKEEDLTFRDEVRQFLRQNLTPDLGSIRRSSHAIGDQSAMMKWHKILYEKGWI